MRALKIACISIVAELVIQVLSEVGEGALQRHAYVIDGVVGENYNADFNCPSVSIVLDFDAKGEESSLRM